jgi:hypothetical protein
VKVEIEIDPACIPAGYEIVAFRCPMKGESFAGSAARPHDAAVNFTEPRLIVRKIYTPPPFFGPGWYTRDSYRNWWHSMQEPRDGTARLLSPVPNFLVWDKPEGIDKFQVKGDAT